MTRSRQFLPGVVGVDIPLNIAPPVNALGGNGPVAGYTANYTLNLVNFDWITWHNYEWQNWVTVDALLQIAIGFLNIRGIWQPNTEYVAGESVFDPQDTALLYRCDTPHTSTTDFEADKPLYWTFVDQAQAPVVSVFGRIGEIVATADDYAAFYPSLAAFNGHVGATDNPHNTSWDNLVGKPTQFPPTTHSHTESQITDLDKYTQAEVNSIADTLADYDTAQDQVIGQHADAINQNTQSIATLTQGLADTDANLADNYYAKVDSDGRFMRYSGTWAPGTYTTWQVVEHLDSSWLCLATTTDAPTIASAAWVELGGSGGATVGDAFPTEGLRDGKLHYKTSDVVGLYVYFDDGDSQQWVQTNGGGDAGDAVQRTGDTMTGSLTTVGPLTVTSDPNTANATIAAQDSSGNARAYFGFIGDNDATVIYTVNEAGAFVRNYRFEDKLDPLLSPQSVLTRELGDGRYLQAVNGKVSQTVDIESSDFPSLRMRSPQQTTGAYAWSLYAHPSEFSNVDGLRFEYFTGDDVYGGLGLAVGSTGIQVTQDIRMLSPITTSSGANIHIDDNGYMRKMVSLAMYKDNVQPLEYDLIDTLRPVTFTWNDKTADAGKRDVGFIAEEVHAAIPEAKQPDNYNDRAIIAHLVKAVQELRATVKELENANGD